MRKLDEMAAADSCLNKAADDEPLFVLRAKDPNAAQAVRHWANIAAENHEPEKIAEARALADLMDDWRKHRDAGPGDLISQVSDELAAELVDLLRPYWSGPVFSATRAKPIIRKHLEKLLRAGN